MRFCPVDAASFDWYFRTLLVVKAHVPIYWQRECQVRSLTCGENG